MSTLIFVPGLEEEGDGDLGARLEGGRLRAAGGAVALQAGLGVGDLEDDRRGELDEQHRLVVAGHDGVLVLEQVLRRVADDLGAHRELVEGVAVHEDVVGAVVVQVLHRPLVDVGRLDLDAGVERLVDDLAGEDVLQLGPHEGRALAGLDVLELDDGPQLALEVEDEAVLEVVGGCHGRCSLSSELWARARRRARVTPARGPGISRHRTVPRRGAPTAPDRWRPAPAASAPPSPPPAGSGPVRRLRSGPPALVARGGTAHPGDGAPRAGAGQGARAA